MNLSHELDRRAFLRVSFLAVLTLYMARTGWAGTNPGSGMTPGRLNLLNTHTGEALKVDYRDQFGEYDLQALDAINWLLRCHYNDEVQPIDIRTIEYLNMVDTLLGGKNEIHIISGYRSPEYNDRLLAEGRNVAKRSLHLEGRAIDIRMPGKSLKALRKTALNLKMGGVGYYPKSNFVHLDSGRFRTW